MPSLPGGSSGTSSSPGTLCWVLNKFPTAAIPERRADLKPLTTMISDVNSAMKDIKQVILETGVETDMR